MSELAAFRYRERFHLSAQEMDNEPVEALNEATTIWSLDSQRAKLEKEREQFNQN